MRGKIEEESPKIEVVARRNPKTQENARVGGSRCRSQRVGPKRKNLQVRAQEGSCHNLLDWIRF
jgi:hypothetical protein